MLNLTAEQQAIIQSSGNIRINAVAGSGKTTTIIEYAATRPANSRILYLAYNKSVKLEAKKRFAERGLKNVRVETAHSLAYKSIVFDKGFKVSQKEFKTYDIAEILGLPGNGERHGEYILANHINKFMTYFCNSEAEKVQDLDYLSIVTDDKARSFVKAFYKHIEKGTRLLLSKMNSGHLEVSHDFYLKLYQLSHPVLDYDYMLFDEAQDASPAMLNIFLNQKAIKVVVGDSHQQIYSWRHAVNSLDKTNFQLYDLSNSFRFGQDIANLAMEILSWKKHLQEVKPVVIVGKGTPPMSKFKATIARTNLGLLLRAITFITEHKDVNHIYFEGNINSYTYADDGASLYDILNLYNHKYDLVRDKLIGSMKDLDDLEEYIEKTEDVQLGMMVEVVKEYRNEIPALIRTLKEKHVGDSEKHKAEMVFSTVHRSKGMEYDAVQLAEDFITESKLEKLASEDKKKNEINHTKYNEEINLLYVAVTRTKGLLRIPETLLPKNFPASPHIHIIKTPKDPGKDQHNESASLPKHKIERRWTATNQPSKPKARTYSEIRLAYKNAYKPWTPELDKELLEMYNQNAKLTAMATHFGRKQGAIISRLKKLVDPDFE
ncbi:UvrD-helicase domain-containing protein [Flavisolibacter ginsengisoli]|jgi:superfamily I DNA/RNA helicase|nr:UvrD-helicase domain-containing protein [Flavisolibacter ginsengisoli]